MFVVFGLIPGARSVLAFIFLGLAALPAKAEVCANDDLGNTVCLEGPAQRIAALSPGATELVHAAGAGDQVVAVVSFSDYPPEAREIQSVGSHTRLDLEALVTLRPDLAIGWVSGNPMEQLETIESLGIPVFYIEPRDFGGVASAIERLARLGGTGDRGREAARDFRRGMNNLAARYRDAEPVSVFYQVWDEPLMTVNNQHLIGQVISLCGGENHFGNLPRLVPRIDMESVLIADPEAIVAGGLGEEDRDWLDAWEAYSGLTAVQRDNLFFVPPSLIQRPTPRLLEGARMLCRQLEEARRRR